MGGVGWVVLGVWMGGFRGLDGWWVVGWMVLGVWMGGFRDYLLSASQVFWVV